MTPTTIAIERAGGLAAVGVVSLFAVIPWQQLGLPPAPILLAAATGALIAVCSIPRQNLSGWTAFTTVVIGFCCSILSTEALAEMSRLTSPAVLKFVAGLIAFVGVPLSGAILRAVQNATHNEQGLLGWLLSRILPPHPGAQPPPARPAEPAEQRSDGATKP